ncbi:hypothetical protein GHT06_001911 [Daphnia sinensis]|uniref:Uncharacterized protein n=1 Tax=Daphnia sinensis TaxID=1820382 RepID=A0AAD5KG13_9CRUS|nr:hypothetical protein GHT06_001911 [Daphnia sinensis]
MPIVVKKLVLANNLPRNQEERMQLHIVCMYLPKQTFNNVLLDEFNASFTAGRQSSNVDGKSLLVATIDKPLVNFNNSPSTITPIVAQSQLDTHIMEGTRNTLPLSGVEKGGFVKLMSGLVGTLQLKKRKIFTEKLKEKYSNTKTALTMALQKALFVCTTADMWSSRHQSFIGMTIHWLGDDLNRRSACLAIRRLKGSHIYDVIAKPINDIHCKFNISKRVSLTIAGNGSNFLKAFRVFGPNTNEQELSENSKDCEEEFCEEDDSFVYIDIDEILLNHEQTHFEDIENESDLSEHININENQGYKIKLPPHMRCSCHILNLIATTDVHNIGNVLFKRIDKLDILFILHNATQWNSYYYAMKCINRLIATKNSELSDVFKHFKVIPLTFRSKNYGSFHPSVGCFAKRRKYEYRLRPTNNQSLKKNNDESLVDAVLNGIEKRFSHMMQDNKLKIAAMSDPHFKLVWVEQ